MAKYENTLTDRQKEELRALFDSNDGDEVTQDIIRETVDILGKMEECKDVFGPQEEKEYDVIVCEKTYYEAQRIKACNTDEAMDKAIQLAANGSINYDDSGWDAEIREVIVD